ncbi:hypothetical protein [Rhizobium etli]|uniref:hypothetical protein n=1 Tax=Rhizobium etli TaxID=29449 RepID=UPI0018AD5B42|nr:hypothetical protein [Rhizobium etli]
MPNLYCAVMISLRDLYNFDLPHGISEWPKHQWIGLRTAPDLHSTLHGPNPSGYTRGYLSWKCSSNSRDVRHDTARTIPRALSDGKERIRSSPLSLGRRFGACGRSHFTDTPSNPQTGQKLFKPQCLATAAGGNIRLVGDFDQSLLCQAYVA